MDSVDNRIWGGLNIRSLCSPTNLFDEFQVQWAVFFKEMEGEEDNVCGRLPGIEPVSVLGLYDTCLGAQCQDFFGYGRRCYFYYFPGTHFSQLPHFLAFAPAISSSFPFSP